MSNNLPKFHPKHMAWLMPLILSGLMSGSISCFNMLMNKGFVDGFFSLWLKSWGVSWLIAFPLILVFLPLVRNFLMRFVQMPDQKGK
jgi:fructose-specific phosphotransferase system IIC component